MRHGPTGATPDLPDWRTMNLRPLTLLAPAALLLVACSSDDAADVATVDSVDPGATVTAELTVEYRNAPESLASTYTLTCTDGAGELSGDSVDIDPDAACAQLADETSAARLIDGPVDDECTDEFGGADTAYVTGTLEDETVEANLDRTDACGTDVWDQWLDEFLPQPAGV